MKKNTHPPYQDILFVDSSTGYRFVCGSTLRPEKTEIFEGKEYPVYPVSVSSSSHPFFTGSNQFIDSEGRVDKFLKRYAAVNKKRENDEESGQGKQESEESKKPVKKKKGK